MLSVTKSKVIRLSIANLQNKLAESLYLKTGIDYTRPTQIYGLVNKRCNLRCKMCNCWRVKDVELPASVWIKTLKSLKELVGTFLINFSGGEPLLKKDFFEIVKFCQKEGILVGITTNGLLLNKEMVNRIVDHEVFSVNISIDSMEDKVHDGLRGKPGLLAKIKNNINYLKEYKNKERIDLKIILKSIVCAENIHGLDKIVEYAKEEELTGVNFQPIFDFSEESKGMLNLDYTLFEIMIKRLISMKANGYHILNTKENILQWPDYFKKKIPQRYFPCTVPLRNFIILPNGNIVLCGFLENTIIGNIKDDDIGKLWYSKKTKELRANMIDCKKICLATCVAKRNLKDYGALFKSFMR